MKRRPFVFYGSQGTRGKRSVSGNAWERRLRREQRAGVGAAVETARARASIGRFGYRKRACEAGSSPSAPAKQKRSPQRAEAFSVLREKKDPRHAERVGQRLLAPPVARAGVGAAVEKIEEKRQPEDFFGHRKRGCEATSSPSAPATGKALKPLGFRAFSLRFRGRRTSVLPHFDAQKRGEFRIRRHPVTTVPSAPSLKQHQNFSSG